MAEFDGVDLVSSFILGWRHTPAEGGLLFEVEVLIGPEQSAYEAPKPNEVGCFKPAELLFVAASILGTLPEQGEVRPAVDADGEEDYGGFDALTLEDGFYHVVTEFADVLLQCGEMTFRILE